MAETAAPVHTSPSASRVREVTKNLLLCDGVCKGRKHRGESDDAYFRRQSHLSLDGRRLQQLGAALSSCPQLQILYLYDNQLTSLQGLSTTLLTHLYVQNNELTDGPELAARGVPNADNFGPASWRGWRRSPPPPFDRLNTL